MSADVKGYQMPVRHGQCGVFGRQASDKPQGRKPRASMGTAVPCVLWGVGTLSSWRARAMFLSLAI
jgi:hypothetical protein